MTSHLCFLFCSHVVCSPKHLLLHLKRFIFVERPIPTGNENAPPNSPSSRPQMEYVFMKNKAPVDLAEELSLQPFCASPSEGSYQLRSLVHHIGARPSSGHYLADAVRPYRASPTNSMPDKMPADASTADPLSTETCNVTVIVPPEEEWVTFDDGNSCKTTLSKIQGNTTKQQTAYMLLYSLEP